MQLFKKRVALQQTLLNSSGTIGFVPTMGALHAGHTSLIQKATHENNLVVVSIFVNPTQFDQATDLQKYPQQLAQDLHIIEKINPQTLVFAPSIEEIYGDQVSSDNYFFDGLDQKMEGASRKGHFQGVATVVERLFRIVQPNTAYFGEKDFQQLLIIKKIVAQANLSIRVIGCPIVREEDGLAMSSRNQRLTSAQRAKASVLYKALCQAKEIFQNQNLHKANEYVSNLFELDPHMELDYFAICNEQTLTLAEDIKQQKIRAFIAVKLGDIRLIDNLAF